MASTTYSCGIDNSILFSSDPNNSASIAAVAVHGAIDVSWQYPSVNPQGISHVTLFRGTSSNVNSAATLAVVKGNRYRDHTTEAETGTRYYYWIEIHSVNGTRLAKVGPASATVRSHAEDTLALLSGRINASALAAALRTQIDDIPSLRQDLIDEVTGRLVALNAIDDTLASLGLDVNETFAAILSERTQRIDGMNVLASQIDVVAASNGQNLAAIINEQTARVSALAAEATARQALGVRVNVAEGAIDTLDGELNSAKQQIVLAEAAITNQAHVAADATGAVATQLTELAANVMNTFRQPTAPTDAEGRRVGSLWTNTTTGVTLQWDGSEWAGIEGQVALDAFAAIQQLDTATTDGINALADRTVTLEASVTTLNDVDLPAAIALSQQGITDADAALTDALSARQQAIDAQTAADVAQGIANTAVGDAGAAQAAADTAQALADAAKSVADKAETDALNAQNFANGVDGRLENYKLQVPGIASAAAQDRITAQIGYCMINGTPSSNPDHATKNACNAAGGQWLELRELSQAIKGVQIDDGDGNTAKIEQKMATYRDGIGKINSRYTVKISQDTATGDHIIGGFGLAIEDNIVTAGFDVDQFWIGKAGALIQPFVVDGDTVFIENAEIRNASIGTLKLGLNTVNSDIKRVESSFCNALNYLATDANDIMRWATNPVTSSNSPTLQRNPTGHAGVYFGNNALSALVFNIEPDMGTTYYPVEITIDFQIGIGTRSADNQYGLRFTPGFEREYWQGLNKIYGFGTFKPFEIIRMHEAYPNKIWNCHYKQIVQIPNDGQTRIKFPPLSSLIKVDSSFSTPVNDLSALVEWIFVQNVVMTARYTKR